MADSTAALHEAQCSSIPRQEAEATPGEGPPRDGVLHPVLSPYLAHTRLPEGVWFDAPAHHGARVRGRSVVSAHLMADTTDRLVAFALSIGLQERWIQHRGEHKEHFDLMGEAMCVKAEAAGAERLDCHEFVRRWRLKRGE